MRFLPGGDRDDYDDGGWRISIVLRISCRVMSPPGALRLVFTYVCTPTTTPQWGTADAEIKNPPGGSQGLSKVPSFLSLE